MTILKTFAMVSISLFALTGCGAKKEEPAPVAKPAPAPTAPAQTAKSSTDSLFDEFYDSSDVQDNATATEDSETAKDAKAGDSATTAKKGENATTGKPAVTTTSKPTAKKVKANPDGRYVLQVSCVASEELAEKVAKKLEKTGFPVYVAEVQNPTPQLLGTYYRIRIGGFSDRESAKAFGDAQLAPNGFTFWVDTRSNDNQGVSEGSAAAPVAKKKAETPVKESEPKQKSTSKEEEW